MERERVASVAGTDVSNARALRVLGIMALVFSAIGLGLCILSAFGLLAMALPDRAWLWIGLHGLDLWAIVIGANGPLAAGFGAILAGIVLLIARFSRLRARSAGWALIVSALAIAVAAGAWFLSRALFS